MTARFTQITEHGPANPQDRELWEYFASLYKNSNKGIKGRGKDRRISTLKRGGLNNHNHNHSHSLSGGLGLSMGMGMGMGLIKGDPLNRLPSMESDEDSQATVPTRRSSYEDGMSIYTRGSSSDGDEQVYLLERRGGDGAGYKLEDLR